MVKLTLGNNEVLEVEEGTSLFDIVTKQEDAPHIYAGLLDGKLHDLRYRVYKDAAFQIVYDEDEVGHQIYERTLSFLLIAAVHKQFPDAKVHMEHSLSKGQYCAIEKEGFLTPKDVKKLKEMMDEMIAHKEVIARRVVPTKAAIAYFQEKGLPYKADLLKNRESSSSSIYTLCGCDDYFYGIMLPDTSYITHYAIRFYAPGLWLSTQSSFQPQNKLFHVFQEYEEWGRLIQVSNVAQLNQRILDGKMDDLVLMSETMIEKELSQLSDRIVREHPFAKFVLIAGPSSAGKTTFSKRLSIHLEIVGKHPLAISMDNFYRNREDCPKLADGSFDFESLAALDLTLFNETMLKLLHHVAVRLPRFNFKTGLREWEAHETILGADDILIIEGIHGLNPETSTYIPDQSKFKIYINALTHLNLDAHNRIPTSDYRLIRRIARDFQFRSWNAQETIRFRKNVRDGEEKNIYPYQEEADAIFNSSMVYELSVLKKIVMPLLNEVDVHESEFLEANRLRKFLEYFIEGDADAVPRSSILAEFIGNSIFDL